MLNTKKLTAQIHICGVNELEDFQNSGVTHLIRISNPGTQPQDILWFNGEILSLYFADVFSEEDAEWLNTQTLKLDDIQIAIRFFREAISLIDSKILFHCDYGASRSPALAYVCLADLLDNGHEIEALKIIKKIRDEAMPNKYVVSLGDNFLERKGKLVEALENVNDPEIDNFFNDLFKG